MPDNLPKYNQCIVSFVDLLGFADQVIASDSSSLPNLVSRVESIRNAFSTPGSDDPGDDEFFIAFSDGIVKGSKTDNSGLFWEILGFVHGITESLLKGYFVRGAITHGSFYHDPDKNIIISPAFIQSYRMEQNDALMPRVIVDPETLNSLRRERIWWKHGHSYDVESKYIYNCLRLDNDGYYYVDYLKASAQEFEDFSQYIEFVTRHYKFIQENLTKKYSLRIKSKYIWAANYHNDTVASMPDGKDTKFEGWKEGLIIPAKMLNL